MHLPDNLFQGCGCERKLGSGVAGGGGVGCGAYL